MFTYKGKILTKFKNKKGGKNQNRVDGFYRDSDGMEYFVKKPKDRRELFTELFAGLLLQEFKHRNLIEKIYHSSLICAQLIQFEDGSYGLIQPKVEFKELYKIIGTGYRDGSDRDPLVEMFYGPQSYLLLTQLKQYYGLAVALMFSLLLGDHSVHSGNVVCLDVMSSVEMIFIQFARIDWGAAFRYYGHKKNNEDLFCPFEYQGWLNPKGYTKGYFLNYRKIKGLFPALAEQARLLQSNVNEALFVDMVSTVLRQLPIDLVDSKTKTELAKYLCMESFSNISFGEKGHYEQFAHDIATILSNRLKKMTLLQDFSTSITDIEQPQIMYVESMPTAIVLPVNQVTPFAEQMNIWLNILSLSDERSIFDFNSIDRVKLAKQFNLFMESLLRQVEKLDQFSHDESTTAFCDKAIQPHPMSSFYRNLFTFDADLKPYLSSRAEIKASSTEDYWQFTESVLTTSFNILVTIRVLQDTQSSIMLAKSSAIHFLFDTLKKYLHDFSVLHQVFLKELEHALCCMSDSQLACVCLHEMDFMNSSVLIGIMLKNSKLWERVNRTLTEAQELLYQEKTAYHLTKLQKFQKDFTQFLILAGEFPSIAQFATKGVVVNELTRLFESLPEFLQMKLVTTLNQIQDEFRKWQRRCSIELEEQEKWNEKMEFSPEKGSNNLITTHSCREQTKEQEKIVKELHEKIAADKILWEAIARSQNEELPLDDLLILKEFYDSKRILYTDRCRRALKSYYREALQVRLSNVPLTEQASLLLNNAHKAFDSLSQSDVLTEAIKIIDELYGKKREAKLHVSRMLFFSEHESGTLSGAQLNLVHDLSSSSSLSLGITKPL
ncbi:LepB GTPase-activating domain-containing protein [Legionella cincinnatiensis]|uniref:Effector protein B n=1 Tax=Legionella cincinnatiensis TaxID=28085 RepID=A0A378ILP9_9GAMM|nr:LepB GTPase-activating domain-containing protein [Legionella cincinnatiensis]KTC88436.1 putative effector protein B [Legionella cincinnatiensis]STX36076.1 substrate of the Dot/Icm secretion system, LepB-like [Legionella cincinnatiensis]